MMTSSKPSSLDIFKPKSVTIYPFGFTTIVVANEGLRLIEPGLPGTNGFTSPSKDAVKYLFI